MDIVPRELKIHHGDGFVYTAPLLQYNPDYSSELQANGSGFKFPLGATSDADALPLKLQTPSGTKSPIGYLPLAGYLVEDFAGGNITDSTRDTFYQTYPDPIEGDQYLKGVNYGNEFGRGANAAAYARTTGTGNFGPDTDINYSDSNNRLTFSSTNQLNAGVTINSQNQYPLTESGFGSSTMNCVFRRVYTGGVPTSGTIEYGIDNGTDSFSVELNYGNQTATIYANGTSITSYDASDAFSGNDGRILIAKSYETNYERYDLAHNGAFALAAELDDTNSNFIGEMGGTDFSVSISLTDINVNSFSYDLVASVDETQL